MSLGLPKCLELNFRGFSHLKTENFPGGGPPDPHIKTTSTPYPATPLPIVSKVLEKIVSAQLKQFIQRNNLLPETQFAYRANHSTEDALTYAVNQLLLARDRGKVTGLVFVDLSKAFDRVEHQALIDLLSTMGISGAALKWFADYLR